MAEPVDPTEPKRAGRFLHRSQSNKIIAGVAGGLGEYFGIDPTIVRLIFVLLVFMHGAGVVIYLVLWVVMPATGDARTGSEVIQNGVNEISGKAREYGSYFRTDTLQRWLGAALLIMGLLFLLNNFGFIYRIDFSFLWPILLIGLGLVILLGK